MAKENHDLNLAVIAGATNALNYLKENKRATHEEALAHVINNSSGIIGNIDFSK